MNNIPLSKEEVLQFIPQQHPFRFIDEILELDEKHAVGTYRFREDEYFYKGHFPEKPLTPGVILIETMAQLGVVAFGIYLLSYNIEKKDITRQISIFTDAQIEFFLPVLPGEQVFVYGEKIFWRQKKLRSKVEMRRQDGEVIASGIVSGMGVLK